MEVRQSVLPGVNGWGLYSLRTFGKGDMLCSYEGHKVTTEMLNGDYGSTNYVFSVEIDEDTKEFVHVDAIGETSCYGRYANDPLEDQLVNAKVVWDGSKLILVAQWDINPGEEILISYEIDYWRSRLHLLDDETRSRA